MNNVLRKISSDTGMWPRFFYYCREIVDESLDLCPWGEPESTVPANASADSDVVVMEKLTRKWKGKYGDGCFYQCYRLNGVIWYSSPG